MKKPVLAKVFLFLFLFSYKFGYCQITYEDKAPVLGLDENTGSIDFGGSGVSFVDYNSDGFDDLTFATDNGLSIKFYKNIDGLFFVADDILPVSANYEYRTRAVTWVDYDNDGDKDIFVTSDTDGNRLFQNNNSVFSDVTIASGFPTDNIFTYGASWGDIDNDGCLDVYLSNRIGATIITNYLFKNNCDGTFSDVTNNVGLNNDPALTFCSAFFDFNNDGHQDLYVSNDKFKPNYLYKNNGDGTFTDVSTSSNTDLIVDAMSVTVDDFNADGYFDIFITNTPNSISTETLGSKLLKNNGDETFTEISVSSGTSLDSFSWGSTFLDAENDGDLDLYVNTQYIQSDGFPEYAFYRNDGSDTFFQPSNVGFSTNNYKSYSCAVGDYNNDGKQEIISNNSLNTNPSLWTNRAVTNNNYVKVELEGVSSNKDGIGSVIEISVNGAKQYRTIMCGEGYLSQNSLIAHFGVGSATTIDYIKVNWLSTTQDVITNVNANQKIKIVEGSQALGAQSNQILSTIYVTPNPFSDTLKLNSKKTITKLSIYNTLGLEVYTSSSQLTDFEIDTSNFIKGIYFVKVEASNKEEVFNMIKK